jgi:hypothetical protein
VAEELAELVQPQAAQTALRVQQGQMITAQHMAVQAEIMARATEKAVTALMPQTV